MKDIRKAAAPKKSEKTSVSLKKKLPAFGGASLGSARAPADSMGAIPGVAMKKGGSCKGYYKGGSVDGCITKGRTKGKIC